MSIQSSTPAVAAKKARMPRAGKKPPSGVAVGQSAPDGDAERAGTQNRIMLNPDNPIPYEVGGNIFTTLGGEAYIPFFNPDDRFAATLLEARLLSTTQFACINTKVRYLVGNGMVIRNLPEGRTDAAWDAFASKVNARNQTIDRVMARAFDSKMTFGNAVFEVVRGTTAGVRFMYLYVKNFLDCRLGAPDELTGEIEYALVSRRFRERGVLTDLSKAKKIPIYRRGRANDADNWLQDGDVQRTIIWVKNEVSGYDQYGMPSSVASLIYQVIEYGDARFNLDNLDNNMVIGGAIFLTGGLSQTEADTIGSTIVKRHTGKGRRGRTAVFASQNGIEDAKFIPFDVNKEGSYQKLDQICESKIVMANDWDTVLAGLKHDSSLGKGSGYLKEVYDQKLKSVIIPEQQRMVEDVMLDLAEIALWIGARWQDHEFAFEPIQIDNKASEASTTVKGLNAFLDIVELVASGAYQLEAAVQLVMACFGKTEAEARAQLGTITVTGNVRNQSNRRGNTDNATGSTEENSNQQ